MPKHNSDGENDLTRSGRVNTIVETMTVVEDRTEAAVEAAAVEYASEDMEVGLHGTILTTYGEPVGGFSGEDEAA